MSKESISSLYDADLLLSLVDSNDKIDKNGIYSGLMTTKIFDYFMSGKPILNISPKNSDIEIFAKKIKYKMFYNFIASDTIKIKSFILGQINKDKFEDNCNVQIPDFSQRFKELKNLF